MIDYRHGIVCLDQGLGYGRIALLVAKRDGFPCGHLRPVSGDHWLRSGVLIALLDTLGQGISVLHRYQLFDWQPDTNYQRICSTFNFRWQWPQARKLFQ